MSVGNPATVVEDLDEWRVGLFTNTNGQHVVSGIGIGVNPARVEDRVYYGGGTVGYVPPKKEKPFIIVDGVVYINASFVKEAHL